MARSYPKLAVLVAAVIGGSILLTAVDAFSLLGGTASAPDRPPAQEIDVKSDARRSLLASALGASVAALTLAGNPTAANAATDCMQDCLKSCNLIAPKDPDYCKANCQGYCAQDDRTDGLSGSVSSDGGEKGILGITTVVKGEDKPPSIKLPGLDFSSSGGKKLIGY